MAESGLAYHDQRIDASIRGEITGEVTVGNYIVRFGSTHGGVIYAQPPEGRPRVYPRSIPVMMRPRPFPGLLNREHETASALAALHASQPLEVYGQEGIGKTSLLRRLAFEATTSSFPDGIVYLRVRGQPLADVQQGCYDAIFESSAPLKPTDAELRHALWGKRALILLDDVDVKREEIPALLDVAPSCAFALASEARLLWGEGYTEALEGLPPDDALQLIERELERSLAPEEQDAARAICAALGYHPLHIIQATALIREEHRSLAALAQDLQTEAPNDTLRAATLSHLSQTERYMLSALAAIPNAALTLEHIAAVTGLEDTTAIARGLERRGLVREERSQYRSMDAVGAFLRREVDLTSWAERVVASLTIWAERRQHAPEQLHDYLDTLLAALAWANTANRWSDVVRLERAIDGALIASGRWAAWRQALQWSIEAARALGDPAAEARALHQLGVRALCLDEYAVANASLVRALDMRTSLGDETGAAVTRHNLALLAPPTVPVRAGGPVAVTGQEPPPGQQPMWVKVALVLGFVALLALGAWLVAALVRGEGATEFTPSDGLVFADQEVGTSGTQPMTVTLRNGYSTTITIQTVTLAGANPGDFRIISDGCAGQSLTSDQTCAIAVGFTPTVAGERNASLNVTSTAKDSPRTVPLKGTGITNPKIILTPAQLEFGSINVNSASAAKQIAVKNTGTGDLTVTKVELAGANAGDFSIKSTNCVNQPIAPGKSCSLSVSFAPKEVGSRVATIVITDTAAGSPHEVALSGTGVGVPVMTIKPDPATPIDFGAYAPADPTQPAPPERTITFTNDGTSDLIIASAAIGGKNESDFSITSNNCVNQHITPGKSCSLVVRFKPTEASTSTTDREAILYITDNTASKTHEVHLKGQAVSV